MTPQELRTSILQYAIQGRLTKQNPNDNSLNIMQSSVDIAEEVPYDVPASWKWFRLEDIATLYNGRAYKKPEMLTKGKYPLLRVGNLFTNDSWYYSDLELEPEKYCENGDLLYAWSASFGPHIWKGEKVIYHYHIWKIELKNPDMRDYLYWALEAQTQALKKSGHGSTMIHITKANTEKMLLPIPPVDEQKRIVAKLEEILPLIDRYEAAWNKLEEFNKRFPGAMQTSILQLAIQGKLVEQRSEEGTGEELFQQIQAEKQALIKAGKIKKEKPLPEISDDEIPFDIPDTWKWVRLNGITTKITDGTHHSPPNSEHGDFMYVTAKNIKDNGVMLSNITYVSEEIHSEIFARCNPEFGDVLLIKDGATTGVVTVNDIIEPFSMLSSVALLKMPENMCAWYLVYALRSDLFYKTVRAQMKGTGITRITLKQIEPLVIPLPPLAEQKRIVAKLEDILPLCNRLK